MAFVVLAEPGTEFGPCALECDHSDCASTHETASSVCPGCEGPIGFGRPVSWPPKNDDLDRGGKPWHLACLYSAADRSAADRTDGSWS